MTIVSKWPLFGKIGVVLIAAALIILVGGLASALDDDPVIKQPVKEDEAPVVKTKAKEAYSLETFSIVHKNNIFDPNRRPNQPRRERRVQAPPPPKAEFLELTGVMIYEARAVAFFESSDRSYSGPCEQGMEVAGLFLMEVQNDQVTLANNEFETTLPVGSRLGKRGEEDWQVQPAPYRSINRKELVSLSESRSKNSRNNRGRGGSNNRGRGGGR